VLTVQILQVFMLSHPKEIDLHADDLENYKDFYNNLKHLEQKIQTSVNISNEFKELYKKYAEKIPHFFKRVIDTQQPELILHLGLIYKEEMNYEMAFACYQKASDLDNLEAQFNLALCYYNGIGV